MSELHAIRALLESGDRCILTKSETAKILGVSVRKLEMLNRSGAIRFSKLGKQVRYRREWIDDYMDEHAAGGKRSSASRMISRERARERRA